LSLIVMHCKLNTQIPIVNQESKYSFSFTGASAMIVETMIVAEKYERNKDWKTVEKTLVDNNSLHKVKHATFIREFSEIKKRLTMLTDVQLELLVHGSYDESKAMILLSLVKIYSY